MFSSFFFHPGFLAGGAALIAAPVIIHLINRYRYHRVKFAAMEFLLASQKRNQKKVYFEQLLLLLMRVLIIASIVALISRLMIDPSQMALFQGAQTHHVVLLDDSGSMQERVGDSTAFDEGLKIVEKLVSTGSVAGGTQKFTMLMLSNPDVAVADFNERTIDESLVSDLADMVESKRLKCSYAAPSYSEGLTAVRDILANNPTGVRQLHLVSDYRKSDWLTQTAILSQLEELSEEGVRVNLVRTTEAQQPNLGIVELTGMLHAVAAGVPTRMSVIVKNYDEAMAEKVKITITLDGNQLPRTIEIPKIEGGQSATEDFDLVFTSPGIHQVIANLETDALPQDNERFLAVDVGNTNPVLIIDETPNGDEGQYLADAISAAPQITGFTTNIAGVDFLRKNSLDPYVLIYLVNVGELPEDVLVALDEYVKGGGGLAWFAGEAVRPAYYTEALYKGGEGLYPVPLAPSAQELERDKSAEPGPDLKLAGDFDPFKVLVAENGLLTYYISVFKSLVTANDWERDDRKRADRVTTLASLRDGRPIMFIKPYGKGQVFTSLTSAGPMLNRTGIRWNNWPNDPNAMSYTIFHLELAQHLMKTDRRLPEKMVGDPVEITLDPAKYLEEVEVVSPTVDGEQTVRVMATPLATEAADAPEVGDALLMAKFSQTGYPGFYAAKLLTINRQVENKEFAFNAPTSESTLTLATRSELVKKLGEGSSIRIQDAGETAWLAPQEAGQEVRQFLLVLLCVLLMAEQAWSYRLSYHGSGAVGKRMGVGRA
jgi:hypothetical protein